MAYADNLDTTLMTDITLSGRYRVIRQLGAGGFGTTFLAEDRQLPGYPWCVVKQLKPKTTDPGMLQTARRLFNTEAEVLYKLGNHEQIPRLFAHFEENQEFYLVQEFIEGDSLSKLLPLGKPLREAIVIRLLQEILKPLEFVHQHQVIHRDLKPANIIKRKSDHKIVLIDFGAVKQISTQPVETKEPTALTIAIGSAGYMPNEQLAGKPRFSSDIYGVGMIGIQALTGLHPKELQQDPETSEFLWRDQLNISPGLGYVIDKMVRYDFRQRYQSVTAVLADLKNLAHYNSGIITSSPGKGMSIQGARTKGQKLTQMPTKMLDKTTGKISKSGMRNPAKSLTGTGENSAATSGKRSRNSAVNYPPSRTNSYSQDSTARWDYAPDAPTQIIRDESDTNQGRAVASRSNPSKSSPLRKTPIQLNWLKLLKGRKVKWVAGVVLLIFGGAVTSLYWYWQQRPLSNQVSSKPTETPKNSDSPVPENQNTAKSSLSLNEPQPILPTHTLLTPSPLPPIDLAGELEAKSFINSVNKSQQIFYLQHEQFASSLEELAIPLQSQPESYEYQIVSANQQQALVTAQAKKPDLKSYTGAVFVIGESAIDQICQTNQPSQTPPPQPEVVENTIQCPAGSSPPYQKTNQS
ncbi:MAG: type IV pilin-like G/H family protein [Coleofasciculus sp. G3-WIS-01]|uniref:protein kinase domain-containing protein n=1 Tax=Coleofasciculus sp. G3-WIS-01 TaxID=3069528 RepID=UPI0032F1F524